MTDTPASTDSAPIPQTPRAVAAPSMELHEFLDRVGVLGFIRSMPDAVIIGDVRKETVAFWNEAARRVFGWSEDEIVGSPLECLIPSRYRADASEVLRYYVETGKGQLIDRETPLAGPALRKDGREIVVEVMVMPLPAGTDPVTVAPYIAVFIRDMTERTFLVGDRTSLRDFEERARRLEAFVAHKTGFAAVVAHELGAPVNAIRTLADLTARGLLSPEQQSAVLHTIKTESDLLCRLVADMESAAAFELDDFEMRPESTGLVTMLGDAVAFFEALSSDHHLLDVWDPQVAVSQVVVDADRIGQVLRNLLSNAIRHTPAGTTVELQARVEDGRVRISVKDAGPGIRIGDLERIFQRYGRGTETEQRYVPGSGLGLYVASEIVRAHGSELRVVSSWGEGTELSFTLPLVP